MDDDLAREWFVKALELKEGDEMFIPATTLRDAKKLVTALLRCKTHYAKFDPTKSLSLTMTAEMKFDKPWVKVRLTGSVTDYVIIKDKSGKTEAIRVDGLTGERERKIRLMLEDGLTKGEIEAILGPLSDAERRILSS